MRNTMIGVISGIAAAAVVVTVAAVWLIDLGESAGAEDGITPGRSPAIPRPTPATR